MTFRTRYATSYDWGAVLMSYDWRVGEVVLDQYEVTRVLGEGGMGRVYKVHHRGWDVDLAVKVPRPEIFTRSGGQEGFVREAETWVNLGLHPHIVSCYYVKTIHDIPHVFAEYVDGGSLADWIRTRRLYEGGRPEALGRILDVAIQMAWGLQYAHDKGLVHQDVKPANVLVTHEGVAKVTDFGLARARGAAGEPSSGSPPLGLAHLLVSYAGMTPAYCSPEQASGAYLSHRSDIWSWGLSVLEMFVGEVTWMSGQTASETLDSVLENGADDPDLPPLPGAVAAVLKSCFAREPERRPATIAGAARRLQDIWAALRKEPYTRTQPTAAELTADGLNNRALSLMDLGNGAAAEETWRAALAADPQHIESVLNRGLVLWRRGALTDDALLQDLERCRDTHGGAWQTKHAAALVHLERGAPDDAKRVVSDSTESDEARIREALGMIIFEPIVKAQCTQRIGGAGLQFVASGDGRLVFAKARADRTFRVWDPATGRRVQRFSTPHWVDGLAASTDGRWALSVGREQVAGQIDQSTTVCVWDVASGACAATINLGESVKTGYYGTWVSDDGRRVLIPIENRLELWSLETGQRRRVRLDGEPRVSGIRVSPDERLALTVNDGDLHLWALDEGRLLQTVHVHAGYVPTFSVSADWRYVLASGQPISPRSDEPPVLGVWDLRSGRPARILKSTLHGLVSRVALSADAQWAVSGEDGVLRYWDVSDGRCVRTVTFKAEIGERVREVRPLHLASDGRSAVCAVDGSVQLWQMPIGARAPFQLSRVRSHRAVSDADDVAKRLQAQAERALADGDVTAALDTVREARCLPGHERSARNMELWSRLALYCRRVRPRPWTAKVFEGAATDLSCLALHPTDPVVLTGYSTGVLKLWNLEDGRCLQEWRAQPNPVTCVSFFPDGRRAVSGDDAATVSVWDVSRGELVARFGGTTDPSPTLKHRVRSTAVSHDGRLILSGAMDAMRLWDVATGRCLRSLVGGEGFAGSACFDPAGRWVLGGGNHLRMWDIATGNCIRTLAHTDLLPMICVAADGVHAVSASEDEKLRHWNVTTGKCLDEREVDGQAMAPFAATVDARWGVSGGGGTLRVWTPLLGEAGLELGRYSAGVAYVSWSQDGRWFVSGNTGDAALRLWEVDWELDARMPNLDEARPYVAVFLSQKSSSWSDEDFQRLLKTLQHVGLGGLPPGRVREEVERMTTMLPGPCESESREDTDLAVTASVAVDSIESDWGQSEDRTVCARIPGGWQKFVDNDFVTLYSDLAPALRDTLSSSLDFLKNRLPAVPLDASTQKHVSRFSELDAATFYKCLVLVHRIGYRLEELGDVYDVRQEYRGQEYPDPFYAYDVNAIRAVRALMPMLWPDPETFSAMPEGQEPRASLTKCQFIFLSFPDPVFRITLANDTAVAQSLRAVEVAVEDQWLEIGKMLRSRPLRPRLPYVLPADFSEGGSQRLSIHPTVIVPPHSSVPFTLQFAPSPFAGANNCAKIRFHFDFEQGTVSAGPFVLYDR